MYTPELLQFTQTKLHSISIIYRLMKNYFACLFLGFLLWLQSKSKKLPQQTRSKYFS
jgi:hypothetical protein